MNALFTQFRRCVVLVRAGLGATTPQLISTTGSVAGSMLPAILPLLGVAGPVGLAIGAAVGGVTALLGAFGVGGGCGQSCIQASNDANTIEAAMRQNLASFRAGQISRGDALSVFDQLWANLAQACNAIGGDAGRNCIADREEGACKWQDAGACWNWFVGYRDPIANASDDAGVLANSGGLPWGKLALAGGAVWLASEVL